MVYSYTQISQYLRCPRSYRYRYLDGSQLPVAPVNTPWTSPSLLATFLPEPTFKTASLRKKRSKLGDDALDNLITLCASCHTRRYSAHYY